MYRYSAVPGRERDTQKPYLIFKMTASMLFILIVLAAFMLSENPLFFYLLPAAVLCSGGDLFLALGHEIDNKLKNPQFIIGVLLFAAAQVLISICYLSILNWHITWVIVIPFIVLGYTIFCIKSKNYDYGKNAVPCSIYGFFVGLSAALGLQMMITCRDNIVCVFLGIGSILFLISDAILSNKLFALKKGAWAGAGVIIFYFAGMWCLMSAISMGI